MVSKRPLAALLWIWLLLGAQLAWAAETDRGLLWRASRGDAGAYLLGSVHAGTPAFYPLPTKITRAFADSDVLVVEADIVAADPSALAEHVARLGLYPAGRSLRDDLSPDTWRRLETVLRRFGLPSALVQRQRPWLVQLTLSSALFQQGGYREDLGVDRYFLERAHALDRPVRELESVQAQLEMLAGFPQPLQIRMLEGLLAQIAAGQVPLDALGKAWRQGDTAAIEQIVAAEFPAELETVHRRLLGERNHAMADKLADWLQGEQLLFVVVGAAHMTGPEGLPELLRRRGFEVERL